VSDAVEERCFACLPEDADVRMLLDHPCYRHAGRRDGEADAFMPPQRPEYTNGSGDIDAGTNRAWCDWVAGRPPEGSQRGRNAPGREAAVGAGDTPALGLDSSHGTLSGPQAGSGAED